MRFTSVGKITLHYALDGRKDGMPLVFIHSLGTELRIWDGVVPHFAEAFRLIRYDLRGHGMSDSPSGPYSIQDHAIDLMGLLAALQVESAILVGISVGGMIAMSFAASYPEQVKAVVLCDTGPTIGTVPLWNERIAAVWQSGMDSIGDAILARWLTPAYAAHHPAEYCGYHNMFIRTPVTGYIATCEAIRDADLSDTVRQIKTKTLVLCGSDDKVTPPELGRSLAEMLPDARFALIDNAAHLPCIEQGDATVSLIKAFFEEFGYVG